MNYEGKRVAILRGYNRLVDGESTSVEEMYQWGISNGVYFEAFHLHAPWKKKIPVYGEEYSHPYTIFSRDTIEDVESKLNEFDLIIMINPARMVVGLKENDVRAFHDMYLRLKPVKVMMQHNYVPKTINSIPFLYSYINSSDYIMNRSEKGFFRDEVVGRIPGKLNRFSRFHLWKEINPFFKAENPRLNKLTYIGRFSPYKGPSTVLKISEALKQNGIDSEIYGMDTSIGCKTLILNDPRCINKIQNVVQTEGEIVPTYGLLEPNEVIPKYQESMFAATILKLGKSADYSTFGGNLEYSMQEAIIGGAILVVSDVWANNCRDKVGVRYSDIENFAVIMDPENPYEAIQEMKNIIADRSLAATYRRTALGVLRRDYDIRYVLPELMTELFEVTKDKNKIESFQELVKYLVKDEVESKKIIAFYEKGDTALPLSPNSMNGAALRFGGKSGKALIKIED